MVYRIAPNRASNGVARPSAESAAGGPEAVPEMPATKRGRARCGCCSLSGRALIEACRTPRRARRARGGGGESLDSRSCRAPDPCRAQRAASRSRRARVQDAEVAGHARPKSEASVKGALQRDRAAIEDPGAQGGGGAREGADRRLRDERSSSAGSPTQCRAAKIDRARGPAHRTTPGARCRTPARVQGGRERSRTSSETARTLRGGLERGAPRGRTASRRSAAITRAEHAVARPLRPVSWLRSTAPGYPRHLHGSPIPASSPLRRKTAPDAQRNRGRASGLQFSLMGGHGGTAFPGR